MGRVGRFRLAAAVAVAIMVAGSAAYGGGFGIFEQGTKAMGMAGAFTAQADDPSALFHNVGGLAFLDEQEVAVGVTLITSADEEFTGQPPGFAAGTTGSLSSLSEPVPHVYWVRPLNDRWRFGLALNSPFGLKTEWEDPDNFSGRYINTEAAMLTVDLSPNLGVKIGDNLGFGFGLLLRSSEVELNRRLASFDPAAGRVVDVAAFSLESDMDQGLGWQVGLRHEVNESFAWGLSYRSTVTVDYSGDGRLTQIPSGNPLLDGLIALTLPLDVNLPAETEIEFPDMASLGLAFAVSRNTLVEADVNWAGWSSFDTLAVVFPGNPQLDLARPENWDDVLHYRLGVRYGAGGSEWRFGLVVDESPQPTSSVSPLLPDADRNGYTVGWGREGGSMDVDLALMYLDFDERDTGSQSLDGFNGTYSQTGWLFAVTLTL